MGGPKSFLKLSGDKLRRQVWLSLLAVLLIGLGKPRFPYMENGDNDAWLMELL